MSSREFPDGFIARVRSAANGGSPVTAAGALPQSTEGSRVDIDQTPPTDMTREELDQHERTISRGRKTFVCVGSALLEIRTRRGYMLAGFSNFEEYCRQRWGLSLPYAYQLIDATQVYAVAERHGIEPPSNEAQARALAPLLRSEDASRDIPAALRKARDRAQTSGRNVTAADLAHEVRLHTRPEATTEARKGRSAPRAIGVSVGHTGEVHIRLVDSRLHIEIEDPKAIAAASVLAEWCMFDLVSGGFARLSVRIEVPRK